MATLGELASLIRSKNAGPFWLTFDILFDDEASFERVISSGLITYQSVSEMLGFRQEDILLKVLRPALAIKISVPRPMVQGNLGESDMYAGQQYAPLVTMTVPDIGAR